MKLDAYPDISDPHVVVITQRPGFAAEEVEQQVTIPIERALNSTPHVIARRSRTIFGLSVVQLTFSEDTGDYFARQLVIERLRDARLPEGITPNLGPLSSGIGELFRYTLQGAGYDAMRLRELQDWVVVPRLLQVPGVADVVTFGGQVRQYQIEVDPKALDKYRLGIRQVADAVKNNNRNAGGALLEMGQQSLSIRGSGLIASTEDIENIMLEAFHGVPVFVRDIGRVRIGALPQTGIFALDAGAGPIGGVEGIVLMRRWENPSDVLDRLHAAVEELGARRLPPGVRIVPVYDPTDFVLATLRTVSKVLLQGFVIVTAALLFFLLSVRAALLVALVIPLSLLFALTCLHLSGHTLSLLSIGALDLGILVDATIVMVERIVHTLAWRRPHGDPGGVNERVREAAGEVQRPIFFSLLIIFAAYIPLLTLERVERRLFTPMALIVCFALIGSLILTLTLVPALASWLFQSTARVHHHGPLDWLARHYARAVGEAVRFAPATVAVAAIVVVGAGAVGTRLGSEFLPELEEGVIWIRATLPAGISLEKSAEVADRMREIVRQSPEVAMVMSQTGRNDSGTDAFGPNRNELLVNLRPSDTWTRGRTKAHLVEDLSRRLQAGIPGATLSFTQPNIDTSSEIATGSSADLAVMVGGPDLLRLRSLAREVLEVVRRVPGAVDTSIEQEADQSQLRIRIDRHRAARYGINVSDVQDVIDFAIGGGPITTVFEGERRFDVAARFTAAARNDPEVIGNLLIPTRDGARVPLAQLADIQVASGASIIARADNERQITVRTNIRGRDEGGFVADARTRVAAAVKLPEGYRIAWGGQFENFERARKRLAIIIPVMIVVIFVLLYATFGSAVDALVVLFTVSFSLAGGLSALYLRGVHLSVSAAVGFISLVGVAVMIGILYITEVRRRRGGGEAWLQAVVAGAHGQFRPIVMLIVVGMLGMMPAAMAAGIGADIQRPLATVIVGGLVSTLFITPLTLPAVYGLVERARARRGTS